MSAILNSFTDLETNQDNDPPGQTRSQTRNDLFAWYWKDGTDGLTYAWHYVWK